MTVAEFIVWLQGQDQEATIQVVSHTRGQSYEDQGGNADTVDFSPADEGLFYYHDRRGNPFIPPDAPYFEQRTLLLGQHDG